MFIFAHAARIPRIFYLVAICGSLAFADANLALLASRPAPQQVAIPQQVSISFNPANDIVSKSEAANASDPEVTSDTQPSDTTTPAQYSSLNTNQTGPANDALPEPFNRPTIIAPAGDTSAKWAELQPRILTNENILASCLSDDKQCSPAAKRFLSIVEIGRKHEGRARLGWINRAVNLSVRPMSDWAQYGYADYWASPLQTLTSRAGDCEDYAILKYVVLRHLGMAAGDLRLVIVRDTSLEAQHAILTVRMERKWLILDNRTMAMLDAEQVSHYEPLFVMNDEGVKIVSAVLARR